MLDVLVKIPAFRWFAGLGIAIVWLSAAWGEPAVLALLAIPGALWWLWQKRPLPDESELTDLL
jgi:hypothetical protein